MLNIFSIFRTNNKNKIFNQFFNNSFLTPENIESYNQLSFRESYPYPNLEDKNSKYKKYIILGTDRTGSSYLVELLKSHPSVISFSELFMYSRSFFNYLGYPHPSDKTLLEYRNNNPIEFIENMVFKKYKTNIKAVGFKFFYYHAQDIELQKVWNYLKELDDLNVIHIKRKNLFHALVSSKVALEKGPSKYPDWVVSEIKRLNLGSFPEKPLNENKIILNIDYDECLNYFEKTKKEIEYYDNFFDKHNKLEVYYEDIVENIEKECKLILSFLNLNLSPLKTYAEKQIVEPMKELIDNYYELKKSFEGTEWYMFFDE